MGLVSLNLSVHMRFVLRLAGVAHVHRHDAPVVQLASALARAPSPVRRFRAARHKLVIGPVCPYPCPLLACSDCAHVLADLFLSLPLVDAARVLLRDHGSLCTYSSSESSSSSDEAGEGAPRMVSARSAWLAKMASVESSRSSRSPKRAAHASQ